MKRKAVLDGAAAAVIVMLAPRRALAVAPPWRHLARQVGPRLLQLHSPLTACRRDAGGLACSELFANLRNPYYIGDRPELTQTLGWVDAWASHASPYAVAAQSAGDIAAAIDFARRYDVRIAVKGGGHSYQGTSNADGSLLIWTRQRTR